MAVRERVVGVVLRAVGVVGAAVATAFLVPGRGTADIGRGLMLLTVAGLAILAGAVADGLRRGWLPAFTTWTAVVAVLGAASAVVVIQQSLGAGEQAPVAAFVSAWLTAVGAAVVAAVLGSLVGAGVRAGRSGRPGTAGSGHRQAA